MKTTIKLSFLAFLLIISSTIFIACDESDGDNVSPVIELTSPAEGAELVIGESISLDIVLKDNEMLSSYKINVHNNFDNHGHEHSRSAGDEEELNPFYFDREWDITGTEKAIHHDIPIPTGVTPGKYHLVIQCFDAANNDTRVFRNIVLVE